MKSGCALKFTQCTFRCSLILCIVSSEGRQARSMTWTRAILITAALACAVITTAAQSNPAPSNATATDPANQMQDKGALPAQQVKTVNTTADGDYVGSETCVTCHEEQARRFNRTAMGKAMAHPHSPDEAHGCESCHGPGRAHVDAGGTKDSIPVRFTEDSKNTVAEKNFACLQCHSRKNQLFWRGSPHESRAMAAPQAPLAPIPAEPKQEADNGTRPPAGNCAVRRAKYSGRCRWRRLAARN